MKTIAANQSTLAMETDERSFVHALPPEGTKVRPYLVRASGPSKELCDEITDKWHSYVKSTERGGRALDYLIYEEYELDNKKVSVLVGTIGYAFIGLRIPHQITNYYSAYQVRSDNKHSLIKARRIAACYRYTLISDVPKNFASQALGASLRMLKRDWLSKYESDLLGVVTFVKPPWTGSCFKAANFEMIGYTAGQPITYSLHHHKINEFKDVQLYILTYAFGKTHTNKPRPESARVNNGKETKVKYLDSTEFNGGIKPDSTVKQDEGKGNDPMGPTSGLPMG